MNSFSLNLVKLEVNSLRTKSNSVLTLIVILLLSPFTVYLLNNTNLVKLTSSPILKFNFINLS